jgi:outer membrane protein TolC
MIFRSVLFLLVGAMLAAGQTAAAQVHMSLDETIAEALAGGPGLQAAGSSAEAARLDAKAASRQRWGTLDAVASYNQLQDDVIVRPISAELLAGGFSSLPFDNQQWHWGVVAEVPLYLGGKLSNGIRISKLSAEKSAAILEGTRWQVRFNVTSLYTAAQSLDAIDRALARQISALEATTSSIELMVTEGKRPDLDRLKMIEELEGARANRAAVQANRRKAGATLLSLMGRDPAGGIEVDPLPETLPELTTTPSDLRASIDGTSPVRQAGLELQQADSGVKIATSEYIPRIVAGGNYLVNDGQSLDRSYNTWAVSLGVVVPLFHGGARPEHRAAAKERRNAAEHLVDKTRLDAAARLEDALAEFEAARFAVEAAEARVAVGGEAARIEQIRYDTGAGTVEDLLRARAREEGARSDLARARAQTLTAGARINSIVEREAVQ